MASAERKEFKVFDSETGLYSTGGYQPSWTTTGKSWKTGSEGPYKKMATIAQVYADAGKLEEAHVEAQAAE